MKAGFFEKDVTPKVGVYLAGYPSRNEPSDGVDDPLFLRVAALEDDRGEKVVFVTADLLKFPRDMAWRTKMWAERELGLPSAALVINLSHTHSAPGLFIQRCYPQWPVDVDYVRALEQSIRDGIRAALVDLRPARVSYGLHQAHFGVSRRLPQPEQGGKVRMASNPDGYYDPDLPVFAVYDAETSGLLAVLYSYACRPTSKSALRISADWPGQVAAGLKQELGEDVLTVFMQGAGASIAPRKSFRDGAEEYRVFWRDVARDLADFVRSAQMQEIKLTLSSVEKEFLIPYDRDRIPSQDELLALADPGSTELPSEYRPANLSIVRLWAQDILEQLRVGAVPDGFRMHVTELRLSDALRLVAMSGEVTAEVGRMVKGLFPGRQTVFLGYCSYTDAYIPVAAMLPEGGHEALASMFFHVRPAPFVAEIDDIIKREVLALSP